MLDLYALILHLHPQQAATLPAMLGVQVHAAFLTMIARTNPLLATLLHEDMGPHQPFGVSLLVPWGVLRAGTWRVQPSDRLRLRVTLLSRPLYESFMDHFLDGHHDCLIGHVPFRTGHIIASGVGEPLAGHATMTELVQQATPRPTQRLRFLMPTTWKAGGEQKYFALYPEPLPLFQKLSQHWGKWAPEELCFDHAPLLAALHADRVQVTAHQLQSVRWRAEKPPTQGFVGWAQYRVAAPPAVQRTIDLLASFSFFAGVGNSTGRGLGVVVRAEPGGADGG